MSDASSIPNSSGIYRIVCTANSKIYVGSSQNLKKRWTEHRRELRNNNHHNPYLQHAWNQYGEVAFTFEVIELVMPWSRIDREQYWLDKLKPCNRKNGFNIARDAQTPALTPETRRKMSKSSKGRRHSDATKRKLSIIAKGMSNEHRQKLIEARKGKPLSAEHRAKLSESNRGQSRSEETRRKLSDAGTGKHHSEETKRKMSESHKGNKYCLGNKLSEEHKQKISEAGKIRWAQKKANDE